MRCIARDFLRLALDRELIEVRGTKGYVVKPSLGITGGEMDAGGVGFPLNDLFEYDPAIMDDLEAAGAAGDSYDLERAWARARPLVLRGDDNRETC